MLHFKKLSLKIVQGPEVLDLVIIYIYIYLLFNNLNMNNIKSLEFPVLKYLKKIFLIKQSNSNSIQEN